MPADPKELVQNKEIRKMISDEITKSLKGKFGGYEIPRKFIYLSENFTLDNGTLTQTMKLKRRVVLEQQKNRIANLYT